MEIVIIGAGVIGCAVARELRRYDVKVTVLARQGAGLCVQTQRSIRLVL